MSDSAALKSFTSWKFDLLDAICADPELSPLDFKVAYVIAGCVNQQSGCAVVADETVADKANTNRRSVIRSRNNLRLNGWLDWRRTMSASVYWFKGDRLNAIVDHQTILRDRRLERRKERKTPLSVVSEVAQLNQQDVPELAHQDVSRLACPDVPEVANILPSSITPSDITPSNIYLSVKGDSLPRIQHHQTAETYLVTELGDGDTELGLKVSDIIGPHRFDFLLTELKAGTLHRPALVSARDCLRSEGVAA